MTITSVDGWRAKIGGDAVRIHVGAVIGVRAGMSASKYPRSSILRGQCAVIDERLAERHVLASGEATELRLHFVNHREVKVLHPLDLDSIYKDMPISPILKIVNR